MTEMQVLVLGLCRTGTQTTADALQLLGIGPIYHMREVGKNDHQDIWVKALEAKFEGKGEPFGREDFDAFLGDFAGVSDIPAAIFYSELISLYPAAKIILTTRTFESWYASMLKTVWGGHVAGHPNGMTKMQALRDSYHKHLWNNDFPKYGEEAFHKHNDGVREYVRKAGAEDRYIEYEVKMGWGPLCKLLGLEVPEREFPWSDEAKTKSELMRVQGAA